jgi:hypothetical protein
MKTVLSKTKKGIYLVASESKVSVSSTKLANQNAKQRQTALNNSRAQDWRRKELDIAPRGVLKMVKKEQIEAVVDYKSWSHESLIQRVTELEKELKSKTSGSDFALFI